MTDLMAEYSRLLNGTHNENRIENVHFYVFSTAIEDGRGDLYVALGLARALDALNWGVSFSPMPEWASGVPDSTTVTIAMLQAAAPEYASADVVRLAWARNAISEWTNVPYLSEFDGVLASSSLALEAIGRVYSGPQALLPIGVDLDLFSSTSSNRDISVLTTANHWGEERGLVGDLRNLSVAQDVDWFGAGLNELEGLPETIKRHEPVGYTQIADLYSRAVIVLDDLTESTRRYGCQNSRLFEAIAAGAMVVTNLSTGLEELGLGDVPVSNPGEDLGAVLSELLEDDEKRNQRVKQLRKQVLEHHTFGHRASAIERFLPGARMVQQLRGRVRQLEGFSADLQVWNEDLAAEIGRLGSQIEAQPSATPEGLISRIMSRCRR